MSDDPTVTVVQQIRGQDAGGSIRRGLTERQKLGEHCLVCTESGVVKTYVGWVGERQVWVHSYCLEDWKMHTTN